jgi:hypothetical protein
MPLVEYISSKFLVKAGIGRTVRAAAWTICMLIFAIGPRRFNTRSTKCRIAVIRITAQLGGGWGPIQLVAAHRRRHTNGRALSIP